ncbi:hypothetical protein Tco_0201597 [Tanacetum coccineum]
MINLKGETQRRKSTSITTDQNHRLTTTSNHLFTIDQTTASPPDLTTTHLQLSFNFFYFCSTSITVNYRQSLPESLSIRLQEGGDSNDIRSSYDAIDEEDKVFQSGTNVRLFQKEARTADAVFKVIVDMVRHKIMGLKIRNSMEVVKAARIWNLTLKAIIKDGERIILNGVNTMAEVDLALKSIYEDGFESAITCINNEYHMNTEIYAWSGKSCAVYTSVWHNWFCSGIGFWNCNKTFKFDTDDSIIAKHLGCLIRARILRACVDTATMSYTMNYSLYQSTFYPSPSL